MPNHPFIFLGLDETTGKDSGVHLEKNLMTFAGAGAGKGATQIIPNLLQWPHNIVCIDPSGEAAEETAEKRRKKYGGTVAVLDPFDYADIGDDLRADFNPLDLVETVTELKALADGLIFRTGTETQPHFTESAQDIATGFMAFILEHAMFEGSRSLAHLPDLVASLQDDEGEKKRILDAMKTCTGFGGVARQTAQRLSPDNTEVANNLSTLKTQTRWIDEAMQEPLSRTGFRDGQPFDLHDLKEGKMTLYLVLPGDKLDDYGRYLRLFTKAVIKLMMQKTEAGKHMGERCLFILDEAFACGKLDEVISASGQMRKYGLHLWTFWQSIGQLTKLYDKEGLEALEEDADALTIFGVRGMEVCEFASRKMGVIKIEDIADEHNQIAQQREADQQRQIRPYLWNLTSWRDGKFIPNQTLIAEEQRLRSEVGKRYMEPEEIRDATRKHEGEPLPRRMLVFDAAGSHFLRPLGYFEKRKKVISAPRARTLGGFVMACLMFVGIWLFVTMPLAILIGGWFKQFYGSQAKDIAIAGALILALGLTSWLRNGGIQQVIEWLGQIAARTLNGTIIASLTITGIVLRVVGTIMLLWVFVVVMQAMLSS